MPASLIHILAKAAADPLDENAVIVLIGAAVAALVAVAAAVPMLVAVRRRVRQREALAAAAVLWGLATAACIVWAVNRDRSAEAERQREILSGDYDPRDLPAEPASPWAAWATLSVGYVGLLMWSASGRAAAA